MDVERRTVISAGLDAGQFKTGMAEVAGAVTQNVQQMARSLLDTGRGFDALARSFVSGYKEATNFAAGVQRAYLALGDGRDKLNALPQILDGLAAKWGLVGAGAQQAARTMIDSSQSAETRLRALQSLITAASGGGRPGAIATSAVPDVSPNLALVERFNAALAAQRERYDPLAAATRIYQAALKGIEADERLGIATAMQASDARLRAAATYQAATAAIEANTLALQKQRAAAADAARQGALADIGVTQPALQASLQRQRLAGDPIEQRLAAQRASDAQAAVNRFAGVTDGGGDNAARDARAADIEAYGKALDDMRAKFSPMFAAQRQYKAELADIANAEKLSALTAVEASAARERAASTFTNMTTAVANQGKTLDQLTGTTSQQQFAMRQLGVQTIQTFQGFATGQPIMMTLIQQGHQVVDVMIAAGVGIGSLARAIGSFTMSLLTNPITLFIIGVTALTTAFAALVVSAQNTAERLGTLRNQLLASRDDAVAMSTQVEAAARHLAQTTNLGFTEAAKAGAEFAKNPAFQGTQRQMEALIVQAHRLSLVLGDDLPAAAKIMERGMDDAAGAAQTLLDQHHFGAAQGVTQAWVDSLKQMNQAQAFQALIDKITEVTAKGRESFTNLGAAWQRFLQLVSGDGPGFWSRVGGHISDGLAAGLRAINAVIEAFERLRAAIGRFLPWAQNGGTLLGNMIGDPSGAPRRPDTTMQRDQLAASPDNLVTVQTKSGASFRVSRDSAANFAGLINDLERSGYGIDASHSHGYRPLGPGESTTTNPHAAGYAIDINANRNPMGVGQPTDIPAELARSLAAKWGLQWGGDFRTTPTDPMHFQVPGGGTAGTGVVATEQDTIKRAQDASREALQRRIDENAAAQRVQEEGIRAAQDQAARARERAINAPGGVEGPDYKAATADYETALRSGVSYLQQLNDLKKAQYDLIDPQQKLARAAEEGLRPMQAQEGMTRRLAEVEQQFREEAKGTAVDMDALTRARAVMTARGTIEIRDQVQALDIQTNASRAQITTTEQGGMAAENAAAFERAITEARKSSIPGTLQNKQAVIDLTDAYRREIEVKHDLMAATDIAASTKELEILATEARLIGATNAERERELAILRERQSLGLATGQVADAEMQRAINQKALVATSKVQNDELTANYNELASATSQAFNTIGNSISDAFINGNADAVTFLNIFKSVVSQIIQEAIKLSIINPILKAAFPGQGTANLPTAFGVFNAFGGGAAAGGAAIAGGGLAAAEGMDLLSMGIYARGGVFADGSGLSAYSNSIVDRPTLFAASMSGLSAYASGAGLMGESGPEAVLPLVRGPTGSLGVRSDGGGGGNTVHINTPIVVNAAPGAGQDGKPAMDPRALAELQRQVDATVRNAVRGELTTQKRPGGDLWR